MPDSDRASGEESTDPRPRGPGLPVPSSDGATETRPRGAGLPVPSSPGEAAEPALPEATFGRYVLGHMLGAGGMGVVYKAFDPELRRTVALKVIKPGVASEVQLARFEREARLAARLRHPGIVAVHDVMVVDGRQGIAMEYVEGRTLREYLAETRDGKRAGKAPDAKRLKQEIEILACAAEAVDFAHREGVLHRDLKPDNVLLDGALTARVMDFGIARPIDPDEATVRLTRTGQLVGTPAYMSPEAMQAEEQAVGPASDVWSLGVMLYEALTGRSPFARETPFATCAAILQEEAEPPRRRNRHVPRDLEAVCLHALERDPAARIGNAGELAEELRRWMRGEATWTRPLGAMERGWRRVRANRVPVAIAALACVGLVVAGVAALLQSRRAARFADTLGAVAVAVAGFEDEVLRTGVPQESRQVLAGQALDLLVGLLDEDPDCPAALAWRGRVRDLLGEAGPARDDLDRACDLAAGDPLPAWLRGLVGIERYARSRGLPVAVPGLNGIDFRPLRPESDEQRSMREQALADLDRASSTGAAGARLRDEDTRLARALAALHGADGPVRALEAVEGVQGPRADRIRGTACYFQKKFEEAAEAYGRVLVAWPFDAETRVRRAMAFEGIAQGSALVKKAPYKNYTRALEDLAEALRADPDLAAAHQARGRVRAATAFARDQLNEEEDLRAALAEALGDYDEAIRRAPDDPDLRVERGRLWMDLAGARAGLGGDAAAAQARAGEDFEAVLKSHPDHVDALHQHSGWSFRHAQGEAQAGRDPLPGYDRAFRDLDRAIALAPDRVDMAGDRASLFECRALDRMRLDQDPVPDLEEAIRAYGDAWKRDPSRMWMQSNRGHIYTILAEVQKKRGQDASESQRCAEADFREALARGDLNLLCTLAVLLRATGRFDEAISLLTRSVEEVPWTSGMALLDLRETLQARADLRRKNGDLRGGLEGIEESFAAWEKLLAIATPESKEILLADRSLRARVASGCLNAAHSAAVLSLGEGAAPGAAPVGDAERAQLRERAIGFLERSVRFGLKDLEGVGKDAVLGPLIQDPEIRRRLEQVSPAGEK